MQGHLNILTKLKDFDERKSQEMAAHAYQQQEIMKLKVMIKTIVFSWCPSVVCLQSIKSKFADFCSLNDYSRGTFGAVSLSHY